MTFGRPPFLRLIAASLCGLISAAATAQQAPPPATSSHVIGTQPQLADGAQAMRLGDWQRGIELTQIGLAATVSTADRAKGLANLCAAHAALEQFEKALGFCNESIAIDDGNWQTWQNRAACHLGLGKIDESLQDLQRGLAINPDSDALQKTLAIARDREKRQQERLRQLVES